MIWKEIALLGLLALMSFENVEGACTITFTRYLEMQTLNIRNQSGLNTEEACTDACRTDATCWSLDFDRDHVCWFGTEKTPTKQAKVGCVHKDKIETCDVNIALFRPAIQSSIYTKGASGEASLAVDGNRNPIRSAGSCSATAGTEKGWWAVDLGNESKVRRVRITNRGDCCHEHQRNFDIGLTNVSPWDVAPDIGRSSLCAYRQPYLPAGKSTDILCDPQVVPGRYLFIKLRTTLGLTLCEVEVFPQ